MSERPVIGLTLDAEEPGGYSKLPWYALRKNYFAVLAEAGALPIALPHHAELAGDYLDRVDGLWSRAAPSTWTRPSTAAAPPMPRSR